MVLPVRRECPYYLVARETPAQAKITPPPSFTADAEQPDPASDGVDTSRSVVRYRSVLRNPKIWSTGIAIGFQNAARYGLLIWVPVHFLGENWEDGGGGINPIWISVALPVGMAVGALTNGQLSDRLFGSRRDRPIVLFMAAGAVAAMTMYLAELGTVAGIIVLFLTGFVYCGWSTSRPRSRSSASWPSRR